MSLQIANTGAQELSKVDYQSAIAVTTENMSGAVKPGVNSQALTSVNRTSEADARVEQLRIDGRLRADRIIIRALGGCVVGAAAGAVISAGHPAGAIIGCREGVMIVGGYAAVKEFFDANTEQK